MYNEIITLIGSSTSKNSLGDTVVGEPARRDVFCKVKSIGQSEFYQAAAAGFKPEFKFVIADYLDYDGEDELEYLGNRYKILRTYRAGIELEIVAYGGVNVSERT